MKTQSQVVQEYDAWKALANAAGEIQVDRIDGNRVVEQDVQNLDPDDNYVIPPERATEWGTRYLQNYTREQGISATTTEIINFASGFRDSNGVDFNALDVRGQLLSSGLSQGATVSLSDKLGVAAELAEITIETVGDGKLTDLEIYSMCRKAGAVVGAVAGQAFGIPAPVGALVGGIAGSIVGGIVGGIFGASESSYYDARVEQAQEEAAYWNEYARTHFKPLCEENAGMYADDLLYNIERELSQKLEYLGNELKKEFPGFSGEFPLVFFAKDRSEEFWASGIGFRFNIWGVPGVDASRYLDNSGRVQIVESYPVCYNPFGCPIPDMRVAVEFDRWAQNEIANALKFYGCKIFDAVYDAKKHYCDPWPVYTNEQAVRDINAQGIRYLGGWYPPNLYNFLRASITMIEAPKKEYNRLVIATKLVGQDLVKSASSARAQLQIEKENLLLAQDGISIRQDWNQRRKIRNTLGNAALVVGGGVLAYAVYDTWKRGRL